MGDILDEAAALVQCKECPWYRACVVPMRLTPEDLRRQMEQAMPGGLGAGAQGSPQFMASLMAAAQNLMLEGCPIFIERLRRSPKLAQRIKEMMQAWGSEEEPGP
ncbi:MAG: hypothetical protein M1370_03680 [Bacteroidetes bacterium]|nr:hypothetical protein [Bacteroidota bacterium]MCL5025075.1 hypothetical protein [Chloroflexota bacterium]